MPNGLIDRVPRPAAISAFPESAEQSASDRGCGAKFTVQSSGMTKTKIAGDSVSCFSLDV
jgi:hypothetical protein